MSEEKRSERASMAASCETVELPAESWRSFMRAQDILTNQSTAARSLWIKSIPPSVIKQGGIADSITGLIGAQHISRIALIAWINFL